MQAILSSPHKKATSQSENLKIITYNCKYMETALCSFEVLGKKTDLFLMQEHWYFGCQLQKLEAVCEKVNRTVQEEPQAEAAANPRHQEEEKT